MKELGFVNFLESSTKVQNQFFSFENHEFIYIYIKFAGSRFK
jgi:hypothetical protein